MISKYAIIAKLLIFLTNFCYITHNRLAILLVGWRLGEWPNRWYSGDIRKHSTGIVGISVSLFASSSSLFLLHGAVFITK